MLGVQKFGSNTHGTRTCKLSTGPLEVASLFVTVKVEDQKNPGLCMFCKERLYSLSILMGFLLSTGRRSRLQFDELELSAMVLWVRRVSG